MSSLDYVTDELPDMIVTLNITETNITINGTKAKIFKKTPEDASINNIILGIGAVAVILIFLLVIIKLIYKCYKIYTSDDDEVKDQAKKSPLLPSTSPKVMMRPKSPARRPSAPIHRSSLNAEFLMEIEKRRFSQPYRNTPPSVKKS